VQFRTLLLATIAISLIGAAGCATIDRTAGAHGVHRNQADGTTGNVPGTRATGSADSATGRPGAGTIGVP
jgi:hypothetical protein